MKYVQPQDLFAIATWLNRHKHSVEGVRDPGQLVYEAGNLFLAIAEASMSSPAAAKEQIASIRRCTDWALVQWKFGNMNEAEVFEYLFFMIARISPDVVTRGLAERLRLAESKAQHLEYFLNSGQ